jgi:hypothetical protein
LARNRRVARLRRLYVRVLGQPHGIAVQEALGQAQTWAWRANLSDGHKVFGRRNRARPISIALLARRYGDDQSLAGTSVLTALTRLGARSDFVSGHAWTSDRMQVGSWRADAVRCFKGGSSLQWLARRKREPPFIPQFNTHLNTTDVARNGRPGPTTTESGRHRFRLMRGQPPTCHQIPAVH